MQVMGRAVQGFARVGWSEGGWEWGKEAEWGWTAEAKRVAALVVVVVVVTFP